VAPILSPVDKAGQSHPDLCRKKEGTAFLLVRSALHSQRPGTMFPATPFWRKRTLWFAAGKTACLHSRLRFPGSSVCPWEILPLGKTDRLG